MISLISKAKLKVPYCGMEECPASLAHEAQSLYTPHALEMRISIRRTSSKSVSIRLKRIYDKPTRADGRRVLVDRIWPRGLKKDEERIDKWLKEIAPTTALRKWFGHRSWQMERAPKKIFGRVG